MAQVVLRGQKKRPWQLFEKGQKNDLPGTLAEVCWAETTEGHRTYTIVERGEKGTRKLAETHEMVMVQQPTYNVQVLD